MPVVAAVVGVIGAASSAGAALGAIGAISAAGTAALTVGSVASIATFVGSVATVVGAVTGDENLLRVGSVVGLAGAATGLAANNLKLFGEGQTLGAAVKTGKIMEEASKTVATGANLDFSLAQTNTGSVGGVSLTKSSLGGTGMLNAGEPALQGPKITNSLAQTANTAGAEAAAATTSMDTSLDYSLLGEGNKLSQPGVDLGTNATKVPGAPSVGGGMNKVLGVPGAGEGMNKVPSVFDKVGEFITNKENAGILQGIGQAGKFVTDYQTAESLNKLRSSQAALYDSNRRIQEQQLHNASAAGRLYGGS